MVAKFIFELNGSSQEKKSIKIVHIRCGQQHPMTYINHANRPASRSKIEFQIENQPVQLNRRALVLQSLVDSSAL
jgi:hypothetical protein